MEKKTLYIIIGILFLIIAVGGFFFLTNNKGGQKETQPPVSNQETQTPERAEEETLSEQPNKAKFAEYFTRTFLAKLPAEAEFNPFGVVETKVFTLADQFCTSFEIKKTIPSGSFSYAVYDKNNEKDIRPKSVFPQELKKGGSVGCEPLSYSVGKYEFKIYIDNVLAAVLPFEVQ